MMTISKGFKVIILSGVAMVVLSRNGQTKRKTHAGRWACVDCFRLPSIIFRGRPAEGYYMAKYIVNNSIIKVAKGAIVICINFVVAVGLCFRGTCNCCRLQFDLYRRKRGSATVYQLILRASIHYYYSTVMQYF
jgi:hypothetical protein